MNYNLIVLNERPSLENQGKAPNKNIGLQWNLKY